MNKDESNRIVTIMTCLTIFMVVVAGCCLWLAMDFAFLTQQARNQTDEAMVLVEEVIVDLKEYVNCTIELTKVLKEAQDAGCLVYKMEEDELGNRVPVRVWRSLYDLEYPGGKDPTINWRTGKEKS